MTALDDRPESRRRQCDTRASPDPLGSTSLAALNCLSLSHACTVCTLSAGLGQLAPCRPVGVGHGPSSGFSVEGPTPEVTLGSRCKLALATAPLTQTCCLAVLCPGLCQPPGHAGVC